MVTITSTTSFQVSILILRTVSQDSAEHALSPCSVEEIKTLMQFLPALAVYYQASDADVVHA